MSVQVSFVIATRNRHDVLQWCLRSCLAQEGIEAEILVYDDASNLPVSQVLDTSLKSRVRIIRSEKNLGYVLLRNRGFQDATSRYVVTLDDDLILQDPRAIAGSIRRLESNDSLGVVALRYYERPRHYVESQLTAKSLVAYTDTDCSTFVGCANIIVRELAKDLGLYPTWIFRQGEERFLSIRLLDAGYRIVLHGPPSAIHLYSPVRDRRAMNWYGIRNALLFDWICVPHPYFFPYLFKDIIKLFFYKITLSRIPAKLGAIAWGLGSILQKWSLRDPVSRATFKKYLTLPRHGPLPLPPDWSPEPLVKLGIIQDASELDPYLRPQK